eukprot:TRINITY_DN23827_c0_g1_i1.p1 TRINITY_DN23827_c0_g1~~TRINITY_DN23827_c0_g1_i1.p1  ORF type:complete len:327 (-),score=29.12 TRINITY_DN23827_c0_g1_i1:251-1231(-)
MASLWLDGNMSSLALALGLLFGLFLTASAVTGEGAGGFYQETCQETRSPRPDYSKVMEPGLKFGELEGLPGFTRSTYAPDHALIAAESRVYNSLPGWVNTLAAILISPAMTGTHFSMYIAHMGENSSAGSPSPGVERLVFVVKGEVSFAESPDDKNALPEPLLVDSYAYIPPDHPHTLKSSGGASMIVVERIYTLKGAPPLREDDKPAVRVGETLDCPLLAVPGEVFQLRKLLPTSAAYDFNIHIMDFKPGQFLHVKEVHFNQHGLVMLEGQGIYRLSDKWFPVQAGDVIWMAPFVPQWYAALGETRSRYFLYKDTNRDPLFHPFP